MEIIKFSPAKAELNAEIKKVKDLTIKGVDDIAGYDAVKSARKGLGAYRIQITKYGKERRQDALEAQREVIRQEKELLLIITPTEDKLKAELTKIDKAKQREERKILLPSRRTMVAEVKGDLGDDEILAMDEAEFAEYYTETRCAFETERKMKEELKEAKVKAKIQERERIARVEERRKERKEIDERQKIEDEKAKQAKLESDKKFNEFLEKNGYDKTTDILQQDDSKIRLYRLVNTYMK